MKSRPCLAPVGQIELTHGLEQPLQIYLTLKMTSPQKEIKWNAQSIAAQEQCNNQNHGFHPNSKLQIQDSGPLIHS